MTTKSNFETTSFGAFLLRLFSGIAGGLLGTVAALLVFVLFSYANTTSEGHDIWSKEFTGAGILAMVFFGSLVANIFAVLLQSFSAPYKYVAKMDILKDVFSVNIFLFLLSAPFYLLFSKTILSIAALHLFISASTSALIAEVGAGKQYAVMGVFGVSLAQIFLFSFFLLFLKDMGNQTVFSIFFLPFIWILLPVMIFLSEKIRSALLKLFSYDLFSSE